MKIGGKSARRCGMIRTVVRKSMSIRFDRPLIRTDRRLGLRGGLCFPIAGEAGPLGRF